MQEFKAVIYRITHKVDSNRKPITEWVGENKFSTEAELDDWIKNNQEMPDRMYCVKITLTTLS